MYAALRGHKDVVQDLLSQQDVDINMRDEVVDLNMEMDTIAITYVTAFMYIKLTFLLRHFNRKS